MSTLICLERQIICRKTRCNTLEKPNNKSPHILGLEGQDCCLWTRISSWRKYFSFCFETNELCRQKHKFALRTSFFGHEVSCEGNENKPLPETHKSCCIWPNMWSLSLTFLSWRLFGGKLFASIIWSCWYLRLSWDQKIKLSKFTTMYVWQSCSVRRGPGRGVMILGPVVS
jgi:hypothetical protein